MAEQKATGAVTRGTTRARKTKLERRVVWGSLLASLILANIVGIAYFGRLDWTREREFTLSAASVKALRNLKEPVTVRAYFSHDLPPPHASDARYVKDLLDSFYAQGRGKLRFEFIDPLAAQTSAEADKKNQLKQDVFGNTVRESTAMERELETLGIPPVQVRVNQADKVEVKRAYMGLAFSMGGRREVIPVVTETHGLEYDITSMLRKLGKSKEQTVAVVTGHAGTKPNEEMSQGLAALKEHYALAELDLTQAGTLLPEADAVLVVGPKEPFTEAEQRTLEAYIHAGHPVGFFLPPAKATLQGLRSEDNAHGLDGMLARMGVTLSEEMVLDAQCATINVQKQQGFMRINQPVRYPYVGQHEQLESASVTRGLSGVLTPFSGSITLSEATKDRIHQEVWVRSSPQSWLQPRPYNLDPLQKWTPDTTALAAKNLVVALEGPMGQVGPMATADADAKKDTKQASKKGGKKADAEAAEAANMQAALAAANAEGAEHPASRVIVSASDAMFLDPFIGKANEALLLNMVDWLMGDDDLLAVRSRGMAAAPLSPVGEARRRTVKYGNILGLPLGFVAFGLQRWRRREQRRQQAML